MGVSRFKALAVAVGAATALAIPTGAAVAAAGTDCPPGGGGGSYPGTSCTLKVSDSTVVPHEHVTVSGSDFKVGTPYTITLHSTPQVLASGTATSTTITRTVTIPAGVTGDHTLSLVGTDTSGGPRELDAAITVVSGAAASGSGATISGGLPATGTDSNTLPLAAGGGALVLVGAGLVIAARRRGRSAEPTA